MYYYEKGFLGQLAVWLDRAEYPYEVDYRYPEFVSMGFTSTITLHAE